MLSIAYSFLSAIGLGLTVSVENQSMHKKALKYLIIKAEAHGEDDARDFCPLSTTLILNLPHIYILKILRGDEYINENYQGNK